MALPVVEYITFSVKIPSTKKTIKMRPFVVSEQKALLQAVELRDVDVFINTIVDIVDACSFNAVKVDELTMYDVDYIFLYLRAKSAGELVPIEYTCLAELEDDQQCGSKIKVELNLNNVKVIKPEGFENNKTIMIDKKSGIKLSAPSFKEFQKVKSDGFENKTIFDLLDTFLFSCVDSIFDGESSYQPRIDFDESEFNDYIGKLPSTAVKQLRAFVESLPYIALEQKLVCPSCGAEDSLVIRDLDGFFG